MSKKSVEQAECEVASIDVPVYLYTVDDPMSNLHQIGVTDGGISGQVAPNDRAVSSFRSARQVNYEPQTVYSWSKGIPTFEAANTLVK